MNGAFYVGAIGLGTQQRALEVVANNIANINTVGFKRSAVRFSELVGASAPDTQKLENLAGVTAGAPQRIWTEGTLRQTGQPLDLAIDGPGFIELMGSSGRSLLWRGGSLEVNADGYLAAADGTPLRAMISVPQGATALAIATDGAVTAQVGGQTEQVGQIDVVLAKDPGALVDRGNGYFEAADAGDVQSVQPGDEGGGTLVQGALEGSNVELSDEMVSLLLMQRAFAADAQVVQASDQMMSIVNGLRR
jgi:flagellar basal-body rod protein FlgG